MKIILIMILIFDPTIFPPEKWKLSSENKSYKPA